MVFSSLSFLYLFLPLFLLFYFLKKEISYKNLVIFIFSIIFYAWGEPVYVILMLLSIVTNYFLGLKIDNEKYEKRKKIIFIFAIVFNISYFFVFKYLDFFIININYFVQPELNLLGFKLPIGISFYTFQIMSYIIDVYRKSVKSQKSILILGTYISLFPQLIAGPIIRYNYIEKQLTNRKTNFVEIMSGFRRFIIGLGKKVIIANQMAIAANAVFDSNPSELGTVIVWFGALAFAFQIYYDFSGYSDMAIGLGKMLGFNFPENFNYPYISKSITEFWRRWHISLSRWFRDYVYISLGGNRVSKYKWLRNIIIVWFLTGLWHGASWNFILWGLYFGLILIIEKKYIIKLMEKRSSVFKWLYSFVLILIGWIIFRVENFSELMIFLKNAIFFNSGNFSDFLLNNYDVIFVLPFFAFAVIGSTPFLRNIFTKNEHKNSYQGFIIDIYVIIVLLLSIIMLVNDNYNPFIYFRF